MINLLSLAVVFYLVGVLLSILTLIATHEVSTPENVEILFQWIGHYTQLLPITHFLLGNVLLLVGCAIWVLGLFLEHDPDDRFKWHFRGVVVIVFLNVLSFLVFCFDLSASIWLTMANGEETLDAGYIKTLATQQISGAEVRLELENYIKDAGGAENIFLDTFKLRLRVMHGEEGEEFYELGTVTTRLVERIFFETWDQAFECALADSSGYEGVPVKVSNISIRERAGELLQESKNYISLIDAMMRRGNATITVNDSHELKATGDSRFSRAVVNEVIGRLEEEHTKRARMEISQKNTPFCFETSKSKRKTHWVFGHPAGRLSLINHWVAYTGEWTGWGYGSPEQQKVIPEQSGHIISSHRIALHFVC